MARVLTRDVQHVSRKRTVSSATRRERFPSYEAALDAAVRYYHREYTEVVEELREKVQEGLDSLERDGGRPLDIEKMKKELRRKHARQEAARATS